jgi:hypothetical protein
VKKKKKKKKKKKAQRQNEVHELRRDPVTADPGGAGSQECRELQIKRGQRRGTLARPGVGHRRRRDGAVARENVFEMDPRSAMGHRVPQQPVHAPVRQSVPRCCNAPEKKGEEEKITEYL